MTSNIDYDAETTVKERNAGVKPTKMGHVDRVNKYVTNRAIANMAETRMRKSDSNAI